MNAVRYYAGGLYHRLDSHHAFLISGGLAFSLFICVIPMILILFSLLSIFFEQPVVISEIDSFIDRVVPYPEYASSVKHLIAERLKSMADLKEMAGILGVLGLLFAASGLFSSLRTVFNTVFRADNVESVVAGKLWDFALIIIGLIAFIIFIAALPALEAMSELANKFDWFQNIGFPYFHRLVLGVISFIVVFFGFTMIYWLIPLRKPGKRVIIVSALTATVLWLAAKELFGYYVYNIANLKDIYGIYAFLIIVAFWIYYSALAMIVAAEIGQLYGERKEKIVEMSNQTDV